MTARRRSRDCAGTLAGIQSRTSLRMARSDHAFGMRMELVVERARSGRDTCDSPDRFEHLALPDDSDVVVESPCDHEEVGTVGQRAAQERFRVVKRGVECNRAHDIEPGRPGSRFYTAPDAGRESA